MICRFRLVISTVSESIILMCPIPADARQYNAGEPRPPAPTTTAFADANEDFYSKCAELTDKNWRGNYFGEITLKIGSPDMIVDGDAREIDPGRGTTSTIVNGRTLLPVRAIVEQTGGTVGWDQAASKVTVSDKENPPLSATTLMRIEILKNSCQ